MWSYKVEANFILFAFTSAADTSSVPFRLIMFTSVFSILYLLLKSAESSQLRSVIFFAVTLAEVMTGGLIEQWMMDGACIDWIGVYNSREAR